MVFKWLATTAPFDPEQMKDSHIADVDIGDVDIEDVVKCIESLSALKRRHVMSLVSCARLFSGGSHVSEFCDSPRSEYSILANKLFYGVCGRFGPTSCGRMYAAVPNVIRVWPIHLLAKPPGTLMGWPVNVNR